MANLSCFGNIFGQQVELKVYIYIYTPRTQMTLVLIGKGIFGGGFPAKIEVIAALGICIYNTDINKL